MEGINKNEKKTVNMMIIMYCKAHHNSEDSLCDECQILNDYAMKRLEKCRYGNDKPTCEKCPIHCYSPLMKEKIRIVMKYSGPRMIIKAPLLAVRHLFKNFKSAPKK